MTLSQTAIIAKQIITVSIITLIVLTVSFIGYKIWYGYYLANLPPVEEKPDVKFGILPLPEFPKASVSSSNYSYSIDTTTGNLPKVGKDKGFDKLIKVYFVTKTFASFLSPEKSQKLAEKFGITAKPHILTETKYQFEEGDKSLFVDLDSSNFAFKQEATPSGQENLDDDKKLISDFKDILANLGVLKEDLNKGRTKVTLLKNTAQISIWPSSINDKDIFAPQFNTSLINATIFKSANDFKNYLSLNYTYYPIELSTFATYPIKTSEQAFEDLKMGKGIVVIESNKPSVSITAVSLGYYLPEKYNPYLQPIFVFQGPHFVGYVSAISEQYQTVAN